MMTHPLWLPFVPFNSTFATEPLPIITMIAVPRNSAMRPNDLRILESISQFSPKEIHNSGGRP